MNPSPGVAVITGAGSGIGREIARSLAGRGHRLALIGRRREPLEATLAAAGGRGAVFPADVREAAQLERIAAETEGALGPADVLVPAAGIAHVAPFLEQPAEDLRTSLEVNLVGAAHLFRAYLPALLGRGIGTLLPILSVAARRGFSGWTSYCASKWGLLGLVEALREEIRGTGVRITLLTPGATASPLWDGVPGSWQRDAMIPVEELGRAVVWALEADPRVEVEEIRLQPAKGNL